MWSDSMFEQVKYKKPNKELGRQKRALKNGRGLGEEDQYSPFIQIGRGDFPSHGRSEVVKDPVSGRQHHFLSWLEYFIFLMLLHLGAVEIREQFPLGLEDDDADFPGRSWEGLGTLSAAQALAIRHPHITTDVPRVQTTDLLVMDPWTQFAVFIRHEQDVPRFGRQLELLKLHTRYWAERGIKHYVLTDKDIHLPLVDLLLWAFPSRRTHPDGASADFLDFLTSCEPHNKLQAELIKWRGIDGLPDAFDEFKAGVFAGQIAVTANSSMLRPLNRPWDFAVADDPSPHTRLQRFFESKVAQHD